MARRKVSSRGSLPAIKVHQWLPGWDEISWDAKQHRAKPPSVFYLFSISASDLKALSGVYARSTSEREHGVDDLGIQRRHESERSEQIARFVQYGYPWCELSDAKRRSDEFSDLRKPGWLPTAIVVNILKPGDRRRDKKMGSRDAVVVTDGEDGLATVQLPSEYSGKTWDFESLPPIEIIDGQHRLWAFEDTNLAGKYELPVVAFLGLDISWQAYLFYTINIKPKKINASLAFDLYPLLRAEEWLTKFEGHVIYRETRAQELVDLLWSHAKSPWHHRINMLGESGLRGRMVTQAAWIRSLLATYIKSWEGKGTRIGGLFGTFVGSDEQVLPWNRAEQAAFLMFIGQRLHDAIESGSQKWATELRAENKDLLGESEDPALFGPNTLLNQDQGIRAFLHVANDLFYVFADHLKLSSWGGQSGTNGPEDKLIDRALTSLEQAKPIAAFARDLAASLADYDWRASGATSLSESEAVLKAGFRGSGGYKELRRHVLRHLSGSNNKYVASAAKTVTKILQY